MIRFHVRTRERPTDRPSLAATLRSPCAVSLALPVLKLCRLVRGPLQSCGMKIKRASRRKIILEFSREILVEDQRCRHRLQFRHHRCRRKTRSDV
jgi:hypothetical protein